MVSRALLAPIPPGSSWVPLFRLYCCLVPRQSIHIGRTVCQSETLPPAGLATTLGDSPRWAVTPRAMAAPFKHRLVNNTSPNRTFTVNSDPALLDRFYFKLLGSGGDKLLSEHSKWLVVTHKSFDHGRRGYNERLAFYGRRVFALHATFGLVTSPLPLNISSSDLVAPVSQDPLAGLVNVTQNKLNHILYSKKLIEIAKDAGIMEVLRWKPNRVTALEQAGIILIIQQTLHALVGAIALEKGGDIAGKTVRRVFLSPMGIL